MGASNWESISRIYVSSLFRISTCSRMYGRIFLFPIDRFPWESWGRRPTDHEQRRYAHLWFLTDGYSVLYSVNWIFANRKYACPWMTFHSRTWISQAYSNCFSEIEGDRVSMDDNEWGKYAFSFSLLSFPYLTTEFHLFWVASTIISLFNSSFS